MNISRVVNQIESNQKRTQTIKYRKADGTIGVFKAAKRGNSTYANLNKRKLLIYKHNLLEGAPDNSIMFNAPSELESKSFIKPIKPTLSA